MTMSLVRPGETAEVAYDVPPDTHTLVVQITNIVPSDWTNAGRITFDVNTSPSATPVRR